MSNLAMMMGLGSGAGGGGGGPATLIGVTQDEFAGSSPSSTQTWPTGTQAGDTAIIVSGFSGYTGGANPPNAIAISTSGWTEDAYVWGSSTGGNDYGACSFYKTLDASDVSGSFTISTSNSTVEIYGLWSIIVVRGGSGPNIQYTQLPNDNGSGVRDSGNLPSSVATNGILIDVNFTRSGYKTYSTYDIFSLQAQHNYGNIIAEAVYTTSYADYLAGGYSNMKVQYTTTESSASGSVVISI
jgi:hypothetical protein